MPCEFRDEVKDWFYHGKWLFMLYDAYTDELLGVCDNQYATAKQLGVCQNTVDRKMRELHQTGRCFVRSKSYGSWVRLELLDAFLDDIGAFLYEVIDDWDGYIDWVKVYTYDNPYGKEHKWYYEGKVDEVPKECLNEIVRRMSYVKGEFRIWITTPIKERSRGRRSR